MAPSHACQGDNGAFAPVASVVSMARCYLKRTCSHHESTSYQNDTRARVTRWDRKRNEDLNKQSNMLPIVQVINKNDGLAMS